MEVPEEGGFSANRDPKIRATRRPLFDHIRQNGLHINGEKYTLSEHANNSRFKSQRQDINSRGIVRSS